VETFTARNRARIAALLLASTANYLVAVLLTGAVLGLILVVWALAKVGELPSTGDGWKYLGIGTVIMVVLGAMVAFVVALVSLPRARRTFEESMLRSPGITMVDDAHEQRQLVNIVDGLAIAAGITPPRVAVVDDPAPNAFGIGTRPRNAVIAVTTGLLADLPRSQVEAVVAYEVTRVASLDVALTTWVIALTAKVSEATSPDPFTSMVGSFNRRFAVRMRSWALRGSAEARDRAAIAMSKNPAALVAALERLAEDPRVVAGMRPETAALWIEVPESIARAAPGGDDRDLAPLLLRERIGALRTLASLPPV
jgi:heat shock protein HtpX